MEQSLRQARVENFTVLTPTRSGPWRNTTKIDTILRYVQDECRTEYLLYADSNDAVLLDDPLRARDFLRDAQCDVLFSCTSSRAGYECMPEIKAWADELCRASGHSNLYLNAGVFIGRTRAIKDLLSAALPYLAPDDLSREEYIRRRRDGTLRDVLPAFPHGVGCDQVIFRFLHPRFYPSVKIDYASRLALR